VNHLGSRVSALVDGELDPAAAQRAFAHAAHCPDCWAAVEAERAAKTWVTGLDGPSAPGDLLRRLHALGEPGGPLPERSRAMSPRVKTLPRPGRPRRRGAAPAGTPGGLRARPGRGRGGPTGRRSRLARRGTAVAGGILSVVGVALGAAFLLGEAPDQSGPGVVPPVTTFSQEHVSSVNYFPLDDPAFGAVQVTSTDAGGARFSPLLVRGVPSR
jgi:hypothetical protein